MIAALTIMGMALPLVLAAMLAALAMASLPTLPFQGTEDAFAVFAADDECNSDHSGIGANDHCGVSMLQLRQPCRGPWCDTVQGFCSLFDTGDPKTIQKAVDQYAEFGGHREGIKIALTRDHFYELYHNNVAKRLSQYLSKGLFAWSFDNDFKTTHSDGSKATVVRPGTITFKMGWMKRRMFWNAAVQKMPRGEVFPYSTVKKFDDCTRCPAKMVFTLQKGGLKEVSGQGWKLIGISIIKLQ